MTDPHTRGSARSFRARLATQVSPEVKGFYDRRTGSIQYVVADPATRRCAIVDPVLDFDIASGALGTTSASLVARPNVLSTTGSFAQTLGDHWLPGDFAMTSPDHPHVHAPGCGHTAVRHRDHVDYLDHGHLHHPHDGRVDEHVVEVTETNPIAAARSIAPADMTRSIGTDQAVVMRLFRTGTISTFRSMDACTILMAIIATITVH
jgi:hypothetical protein